MTAIYSSYLDNRKYNKLQFFEPYEYQKKYYSLRAANGKVAKARCLLAANQIGKCSTINTLVLTSKGELPLKKVWGKEIEVLTYPGLVPRRVLKWIRKPAEECFRVVMSDGRWFESPLGHRVLTSYGWLSLELLFQYLPKSVFCRPPSSSVFCRLIHVSGVRRYIGTIQGYLDRYLKDCRLYGGQLLSDEDGVQVFAPSKNDVQQRTSRLWHLGVLAGKYIGSLCEQLFRRSSQDVSHLILGQSSAYAALASYSAGQSYSDCTGTGPRFHAGGYLVNEGNVANRYQSLNSFEVPNIYGNEIVSVYSVGVHTLYDMEVEERHNYIAGGMVHHNTLGEGAETAIHATGLYPEWWDGVVVNPNPMMVCSGVNAYRTRDLIQKQLLGTSNKDDRENVGTGWVPKHLIHDMHRKPGIPGALEKLIVKRNNGMGLATIALYGYEDGPQKVMGDRIDYGWNDEEPPIEFWSQMVRGTIATNGYLALTYTPENGMTQLVYRFMHECPENYALLRATWEDAPHITKERREELLKELLPYEVEMRSRGEPLVGSSLIFPIPDTMLQKEAFPIPEHWPQIIAIDFGGDHPFAAVRMAIDPDGKKKTVYIVDAQKHRRLTISQEASIIRGMGGDKLPVAWPHDGNKLDKPSGKPVADLYRKEGVNMLEKCFSNPPEIGDKEDTGGQGVEAGLRRMYWAMTEGRFKVFSHLNEWFKEKGTYHKKATTDGESKIVRLNEDLMSASRYAYQSALYNDDTIRYAKKHTYKSDFLRPIKLDLKFVH